MQEEGAVAMAMRMMGLPQWFAEPASMNSDSKDPAQEFAERVADEWFKFEVGKGPRSWQHVQLIFIIFNELRAGGWVQLPAMIGRLEGALGTFAEKEMARVTSPGM